MSWEVVGDTDAQHVIRPALAKAANPQVIHTVFEGQQVQVGVKLLKKLVLYSRFMMAEYTCLQ